MQVESQRESNERKVTTDCSLAPGFFIYFLVTTKTKSKTKYRESKTKAFTLKSFSLTCKRRKQANSNKKCPAIADAHGRAKSSGCIEIKLRESWTGDNYIFSHRPSAQQFLYCNKK
jgi:hypothetical protein